MFAPSVQDSLAVEATLFGDHKEVYDSKFKDDPLNVITLEYWELVVESIRVHDVRVGEFVHLVKSKNVLNETGLLALLSIC
jgi:hypothetical protein